MSGANGFPDFFKLRGFGKNEDERFLRFLKILEFEPLWRRDAWGFDARFDDVSCMATWEGDPLRPETIKVNFDMLEDERSVR